MPGRIEGQKERFSRAFITAAACAAGDGFSCYPPTDDVDAVDMVVTSGGITVDFQLKSTVAPIDQGDSFAFDLDVRAYNLLRNPVRSGMAALALIVLHKDTESWVCMDHSCTQLAYCAYFLPLHGLPETTNSKKIRLAIPKSNVLTPDAMRQLMKASRARFTS